jgi:uncharacterized membrane protein YkgB
MTQSVTGEHPRLLPTPLQSQAHALPWADLGRIGWTTSRDVVPHDPPTAPETEPKRSIQNAYSQIEERIVAWMAANGIALLRVSLGIVFVWFGGLKFLPGLSPAEGLVSATMAKLTFGMLDPKVALELLAVWETTVGLLLVFGAHLRIALALLFLQMAGTLTPLALFPAQTFTRFPFAPTMEGQYILKNLVLISAAIVIGATVRGGKLVAECSCGGEPGCEESTS